MPPTYVIPEDITYIIKTTEGTFIKLWFIDYTDDSGSGGHIKFNFKEIK